MAQYIWGYPGGDRLSKKKVEVKEDKQQIAEETGHKELKPPKEPKEAQSVITLGTDPERVFPVGMRQMLAKILEGGKVSGGKLNVELITFRNPSNGNFTAT